MMFTTTRLFVVVALPGVVVVGVVGVVVVVVDIHNDGQAPNPAAILFFPLKL